MHENCLPRITPFLSRGNHFCYYAIVVPPQSLGDLWITYDVSSDRLPRLKNYNLLVDCAKGNGNSEREGYCLLAAQISKVM